MYSLLTHEVVWLQDVGARLSSRKLSEFREPRIKKVYGSSALEASLGQTRIHIALIADKMVPSRSHPNEGRITIRLFGSQVSTLAKILQLSDATVDELRCLPTTLQRLLRAGSSLDLQALCAIRGILSYHLQIFITLLNYDGGLLDLSSFALNALLNHFRNSQAVSDYAIPLLNQSFFLTFRITDGDVLVCDPDAAELYANDCLVTLGVTSDGRICELIKTGSIAISTDGFEKITKIAKKQAAKLTNILEDQLKQFATY